MINLYDGNNVLRRLMEKHSMPSSVAINMRLRYEQTTAADIWVFDGYDHNAKRREIYPLYKTNRTPMAEDVFSQIKLWRDVLKLSPAAQVEVHGWEADDVIGTMVRKYPGRFKVHTNDMDYGQVAHLCRLEGVNMKGVPPERVALFKALNGDTSDNIKGVPGFGHKRWLEMKDHWDAIQQGIVAGSCHHFADLPFKPAVKAWLMVPENIKLLQDMLTVTHFMNVPDDEIEGGIVQGKEDRKAAHALLSEYFM